MKTPEGVIITFRRDKGVPRGMPYIEIREWKEGFGTIETVRKNFEGFTKEDKLSRKIHSMVGNTPAVRFKEIMSAEGIINCPVEVNDINNSSTIFGPNCNRLRGESTRQKLKRVREEYIKTPRDFYRLNKFVTLTADVIFVNSIPFLVTLSGNIILITVEHVATRTVV